MTYGLWGVIVPGKRVQAFIGLFVGVETGKPLLVRHRALIVLGVYDGRVLCLYAHASVYGACVRSASWRCGGSVGCARQTGSRRTPPMCARCGFGVGARCYELRVTQLPATQLPADDAAGVGLSCAWDPHGGSIAAATGSRCDELPVTGYELRTSYPVSDAAWLPVSELLALLGEVRLRLDGTREELAMAMDGWLPARLCLVFRRSSREYSGDLGVRWTRPEPCTGRCYAGPRLRGPVVFIDSVSGRGTCFAVTRVFMREGVFLRKHRLANYLRPRCIVLLL